MPLAAGTRLGRYEISGGLGVGGMGEVYRGRDTRLQRDVAIKIVRAGPLPDWQAAARLEREARAIASLSHPNICVVHDVGHEADVLFVVMELLDGENLHRRLTRGPFDARELVEGGLVLADALDAAHTRGILHRDLKPGNIFVTSRGELKILDFGLAKTLESSDATTRIADDPLTEHGAMLGTLGYMSPEQLRGEPLDARSDLFSLGLVLYEMATGRRAFQGRTDALISAAILGTQPTNPRTLRPDLPAGLDDILLKTLEKERGLRHQGAADLRADLRRLQRELTQAPPPAVASAPPASPASPSRGDQSGLSDSSRPAAPAPASSDAALIVSLIRRHRLAACLTAAVVIGTSIAALTLSRRGGSSEIPNPASFPDLLIQPLTLTGDTARSAISSDGRFVAYRRENTGLWARQITSENEVHLVPPIPGRRYVSLSITPDGNSVDFVAIERGVPDLWRVPLFGGTPRRIVQNVWSATGWSPDGRRMAFVRTTVGQESSVVITDADGSHERILSTRRLPLDFPNDSWFGTQNRPSWSPDGTRLALIGGSLAPGRVEAVTELITLDAATGATRSMVPVKDRHLLEVAWLDGAHLLVNAREASGAVGLWSCDLAGTAWVPVTREGGDYFQLNLTSDARTAVATRTERKSAIWLANASGENAAVIVPETPSGAGNPFIDSSGTVLYFVRSGDGSHTIYRLPRGAARPALVASRTWPGFASTSDGRVVVFIGSEPSYPLYRVNSDGSGLVRLVERAVLSPVITPDNRSVLFGTIGAGVFSVSLDGGPVQKISDRDVGGLAVSPDGRSLLFETEKPGVLGLCALPACTNETPLQLPAGVSWQWAPDGRGIAYVNAADQGNLWKQPLDGGAPSALTHVPDAQILEFRWSHDGTQLAFSRGKRFNDIVLIKGLRGVSGRAIATVH